MLIDVKSFKNIEPILSGLVEGGINDICIFDGYEIPHNYLLSAIVLTPNHIILFKESLNSETFNQTLDNFKQSLEQLNLKSHHLEGIISFKDNKIIVGSQRISSIGPMSAPMF